MSRCSSPVASHPRKSSCLVTPMLYASSQDCCQNTKKGIPEIHLYSSESPKSLYFRLIEFHIYFCLDRRQTVSTWNDTLVSTSYPPICSREHIYEPFNDNSIFEPYLILFTLFYNTSHRSMP